MKMAVGKLYYSYQYGGLYFIWLRVLKKVFGRKNAEEFLYKKSRETLPGKYKEELIKIYGLKTGKKLNLEEPVSFNEKIQWMKLYDTTELKTILADKYLVREWIKEKIGEQYLIPLLGVWDTFDDIKISELPTSFALKTNHGSGCNIVVKDKETMNREEVKEKFDNWMSVNYAFMCGFEMQYLNISPKIIAEQYIENEGGNLYDYKIHCFNGKPEYIQVIGDRDLSTHYAKVAFYNTKWELQSFDSGDYPHYENEKKKPDKLEEMLQIASKLSEEFIYVRVDLYELDNGNIKFGEMTFTPGSGFLPWKPSETDQLLGKKMNLPEKRQHFM